jgi:hypothetical protein
MSFKLDAWSFNCRSFSSRLAFSLFISSSCIVLSIDFATTTAAGAATGVGVGVSSGSSSKDDSGPRGLSCFLVGVVVEVPRRLELNFEDFATGLARYCGPVPIWLLANPIEGLTFGVASFAGVCRTGD